MTIDLNELERKAKLLNEQFDLWTDNRPDWHDGRLHPRVVIALINARFRDVQDAEDREKDQRHRAEAAEKRVAELEREVEETKKAAWGGA